MFILFFFYFFHRHNGSIFLRNVYNGGTLLSAINIHIFSPFVAKNCNKLIHWHIKFNAQNLYGEILFGHKPRFHKPKPS